MDTDVASDHTLLSGAPQWAGVCVWVCVLSQPAASYTLRYTCIARVAVSSGVYCVRLCVFHLTGGLCCNFTVLSQACCKAQDQIVPENYCRQVFSMRTEHRHRVSTEMGLSCMRARKLGVVLSKKIADQEVEKCCFKCSVEIHSL